MLMISSTPAARPSVPPGMTRDDSSLSLPVVSPSAAAASLNPAVLKVLAGVKDVLRPGGISVHWEPNNQTAKILSGDKMHPEANLCWQTLCRIQAEGTQSDDGKYVHGYDPKEVDRLKIQARHLAEIFGAGEECVKLPHEKLDWNSNFLEIGCGVGANFLTRIPRFGGIRNLYGIDISEQSLAEARETAKSLHLAGDVKLRAGDLTTRSISGILGEDVSIDLCLTQFVMEHIADNPDIGPEMARHVQEAGLEVLRDREVEADCARPGSEATFATAVYQMLLAQKSAIQDRLKAEGHDPVLIWRELDRAVAKDELVLRICFNEVVARKPVSGTVNAAYV